jgi:hypothetical protein
LTGAGRSAGLAAAPDSNLDRRLVLNAGMQRTLTRLFLAALAATLVLPATATAKIIEVGEIGAKTTPSCPTSPCEVISRTTAYQARVGAQRQLFVVPKDGRIVAWSIALGTPGKKQRAFFEENLGGEARAGITVLRPGTRHYGRVTGQSPIETLTPYFGQTVQYPLATSLDVKAGYIVALTVPTWAPALGLGLGRDSAWRASRAIDGCDDTQTQSAQTNARDLTQYKCAYRTARLTYSATLITTPLPPEPPKKPKPKP